VSEALPSISEVAAQVQAAKTEKAEVKTSESPTEEKVKTDAPESAQNETKAEPISETPKVEPKKDPDSRKFAALSQKERKLREREQQFQKQQREWEAKQREFDDKFKQLKEREESLTKGKRPLDVLKAAGFSYEQATQDVLGGYKPAEPDPMDQKLEPINQRLSKLDDIEEKLTKWEQSLQAKEQQQNYRLMMDSIKETVEKNQEKYELVHSMGEEGVDLIKDVMVEYYNEHEQLLTYEEACEQVEAYYEKELLERLSKTKKVQSRFKPVETSPTPPASPKPQEKPQPKTLTADMTSGGEATVDIDKMSPREALEYLSKKLKFS
jgi:DNA repair exonuclease SbcCD ATPase subunit